MNLSPDHQIITCLYFTAIGALIEYAVILFKKQKLSKFGAPGSGSVSYPHSANAMSNYMSIRRPPNKEDTASGVRAAQIRQRRQEQQTQYDMNPITSCRYNWNQGSLLQILFKTCKIYTTLI